MISINFRKFYCLIYKEFQIYPGGPNFEILELYFDFFDKLYLTGPKFIFFYITLFTYELK